MAYKDKDKQRQVQREWVRQKRAKTEGSTGFIIPSSYNWSTSGPDACGTKHKVDYEGRRKDYAILKAWAEGNGTELQQTLGRLAFTYGWGGDVDRYLGLTGHE